MAVTVVPVDAVAGEPTYSGRETRGPQSAMWFGKTAALPLGARSGVAWGTSTATITVSGTTVTIKPHAGVLALQAAVEASAYLYANDANTTLTHDAAHATYARKDLICALLDDPAESDGSTVPAVTFTLTKGAEDGSNVVPATPARSMPLAAVNIPASGGGASTITWIAEYAVAAGGIIPVRDTTEWAALQAAYPPSTEAISVTARKDATAGKWIELSADGSAKYIVDSYLSTRVRMPVWVVADVAARAALATAYSPTTANPLAVFRSDAVAGYELETTTDGTIWHVHPSFVGTRIGQRVRTAGNITLNQTAWTDLAPTWDAGAADISLAAVAGDVIGVTAGWISDVTGAMDCYFNVICVNSGTGFGPTGASDLGIVYWHGTASVATNIAGTAFRTLVAGDISAGVVALRLRYRLASAGTKVLLASSAAPARFAAMNYGQAA